MIEAAGIDLKRERQKLAEAERLTAAAIERRESQADAIDRGRADIEVLLAAGARDRAVRRLEAAEQRWKAGLTSHARRTPLHLSVP